MSDTNEQWQMHGATIKLDGDETPRAVFVGYVEGQEALAVKMVSREGEETKFGLSLEGAVALQVLIDKALRERGRNDAGPRRLVYSEKAGWAEWKEEEEK